MSRPASAQKGPSRPTGIVVIALVLLLEGAASLGLFAWYGFQLLTKTPLSLGGVIFMMFMLLLIGVWLLAVGHFLFRGYRWTRSAALVFQMFAVIFSVSLFGSGAAVAGTVLLVPAAAALLLLFSEPVSRFLVRLTDKTTAF